MQPKETDEIVCQNPKCEFYHKKGEKNVVKSGKYKTGHQRYYCKHCGKYFMDTVGTSIYRKHLSNDEIRMIYRLYIEGNGIRSIERITGHHRDTISKLLKETIQNEKTEEYLINQIGLTSNECKKLWKILEAKRKPPSRSSEK